MSFFLNLPSLFHESPPNYEFKRMTFLRDSSQTLTAATGNQRRGEHLGTNSLQEVKSAPESKRTRSDSQAWAHAPGYLFYYLSRFVEPAVDEWRRWRRRRRRKSVLDLIFHTPASYKRLSYTTLAANNQPGKGSRNDEIPCHLLPDLFS